jgi:hypothetical protein
LHHGAFAEMNRLMPTRACLLHPCINMSGS